MNRQIITAAHAAWNRGATARAARNRYKRYAYGDQWSDPALDASGAITTEGDMIRSTGRRPPVNNLIRRLIKTIVGRYRNMTTQAGRYDGNALNILNDLAELDARLLEEFLISGSAIQRIATDTRPSGSGIWVDNVSPDRFFTSTFRDPRGHDVEMCGMLHDMSMPEILARFGQGSVARCRWLQTVCADTDTPFSPGCGDISFYNTGDDARCRVIEVWTLDAVQRQRGTKKVNITFEWHCRWLTPAGHLLCSYQSPWAHGRHPFVFSFYPFTDGEVHPFVEDVIDIQRYVNRLIALIDHIMGASAKGVLLFPVTQKVPEMSWEEVVRRWSACDGVIPVTGMDTVMPHQVNTGNADAGAHRLLELELKLLQDVSGVSESLMGNISGTNIGSRIYESQVANSTIALADIFETFSSLTKRRDQLAAQIEPLDIKRQA